MNNSEQQPSSLTSSLKTEASHPVSLPFFLTSSSSSLKPLRERNRTNSKRRIKLSRSQVLSTDFENENAIPTTNNAIHKTIGTSAPSAIATNSQIHLSSQATPSTPNPVYNELCSKVLSPTTPSPIHSKVTCSQVWERLASHEEAHTSTSPKQLLIESESEMIITATTATTTNMPTHISFSYDRSDDDEDVNDDDINPVDDEKSDFQYVPLSNQPKLVQCQFLAFARQQQFLLSSDDDDSDEDEDEDEDDDDDDDLVEDYEFEQFQCAEGQEIRPCKKRKRSTSDTESVEKSPFISTEKNELNDGTSSSKQPRAKKAKTKDPNANFQRLNMRKKNFSQGKKHQFSKNKRNAFYRRMRNAANR